MGKQSIGGEVASAAVKSFRALPTYTLARKIHNENPGLYTSIESARGMVKYYRGKSGADKAETAHNHAEHFDDRTREFNPFEKLPDGVKEFRELKPYTVPGERVAKINDLHLPYHDKTAIMAALHYIKGRGVDTIVMDEVVDFYQLSRFEKDPKNRPSNKSEIKMTVAFFGYLRQMFPDVEIIWKLGNHDERLMRYLRVCAPEILDLSYFKPSQMYNQIFRLKNFGIKIVHKKEAIRVGKLNLLHGHELNGASTAVNPAKGVYNKAAANVAVGHWHRSSEHLAKNINNEVIGCWSVGCLCGLHPEYAKYNQWNHGFALIERKGVHFEVLNKKIFDGEVL